MLTILAALNDEIKLIRAEMEVDKAVHIRPFTVLIGSYQNQKISLVRTGVGKEAMKSAISYCIANNNPSLLINIGYAGGLDPHLHAGDIVIANAVVDESTEQSWNIDRELLDKAVAMSEASEIRCHVGKIITVDSPLRDPHQKAFIGTRFEAVACDMESASFAKLATEANLPFIIARSILDPMDTTLPNIPEEVVSEGEVNAGSLMKYLKSNPKDILKLPRFSYLCNQARISMTKFVKEWVGHEESL